MLADTPKIIRRMTRTPTILIQVDGNCIKPKTLTSKEVISTNCKVQNRTSLFVPNDLEYKTSFQDKIRFFENLGQKKIVNSLVIEKKVDNTIIINKTPSVRPVIIKEERTFDFKSLISRWENVTK